MEDAWRCRRRAVAFVRGDVGGFVAACAMCAEDRFVLERIERQSRRCEFEAPKSPADSGSSFALVIAEAVPRCACGAVAEVCGQCAGICIATSRKVLLCSMPRQQPEATLTMRMDAALKVAVEDAAFADDRTVTSFVVRALRVALGEKAPPIVALARKAHRPRSDRGAALRKTGT